MSREINRLGRILWRWLEPISNWDTARVTAPASEATNNLVKRVKRAAFGFANFANYHIRPCHMPATQLDAARHFHSILRRGEPVCYSPVQL